jgi:regulation of enolase protein 1 (concanavalin A-like superfamily)
VAQALTERLGTTGTNEWEGGEMAEEQLKWLNEPPRYTNDGGLLRVTTGHETDFWRETFYGFWRDNGHFLYRSVTGDFTAEVTIKGEYEALYDQAGLMMRLGETHWVKAGIEFTDGRMYFSVVITNDVSDWSLVAIPTDPAGVRIRLTRHREAVRVQYLDSGDNSWKPVRLGYFPPSDRVDVGMMCCSPQRAGFEVAFADFVVGPPISKELHD